MAALPAESKILALGRSVLRLRNRDYYPLVLLLIPVVALTGDRSLNFNAAGHLDPWMYYGFFRHLTELKRLFPYTYYGSRLPWILPGHAIYHIFPSLLANYVLHLLVWYGCVLSTYVVIRETGDRRTALLSATVFGFYPYLWAATGWDYVDGAGLAYYLLTAACLVFAARDLPSRTLLFIAGAAASAAVYCNLILALLLPFLLLCWLVLRRARSQSWSLMQLTVWMGAGVMSLTIVLAIVNHRLDGMYQFYLPSIRYATATAVEPNRWRTKDPAWMWHAPWLVAQGLALLLGAVACLRQLRPKDLRQRMVLALYANFVLCLGAMLYFELHYGPILEFSYYSSYLLGPTFLFFGAFFFRVPEKSSHAAFAWMMIWCFTVCSIVWWDRQQVAWRLFNRVGWRLALVLISAGFVAKLIWPARLRGLLAAIAAVGVLLMTARPLFSPSPQKSEDAFVRISEAADLCEAVRHGRMIRFWLDRKDPTDPEFESIASTYLDSFFSVDFPYAGDRIMIAGKTLLVVISSAPNAGEGAIRAVRSAQICAEFSGEKTISRGGIRYTLAFLDVDSAHCDGSASIVR